MPTKYAPNRIRTRQTTCYHVGDDGDLQRYVDASYEASKYIVLTTGAFAGTSNIDSPAYAANTISFSHGLRQVETATIVATITQAGNATITVTAADGGNLAAGKAISVAVALNDTADLVAGKVRTALGLDADVAAFCVVSGATDKVILTVKTAAATDASMNIASADGTCIGITAAANSANTTAGDATTNCIYDTNSGLAILKTADTIIFHGTTSNTGALTVATGNVAGLTIVTESVTNEVAGAYFTICKRAAHSNNCVLLADSPSGKMYARYSSSGDKVGIASDGKLAWYDATKCYTIHPAAADLQMIAGGKGAATLRIVGGAGEVGRYFAGMCGVNSGFAQAVNNLPGYRVTAVTVNGADLDLTLWTGNQTLIAEAAGGSRDIKIICSSVFSYIAAANQALLGGYSDWVVPMDLELKALCDMEQPDGSPDATAFPSWATSDDVWSSVTLPNNTAFAMALLYTQGQEYYYNKTNVKYAALVR